MLTDWSFWNRECCQGSTPHKSPSPDGFNAHFPGLFLGGRGGGFGNGNLFYTEWALWEGLRWTDKSALKSKPNPIIEWVWFSNLWTDHRHGLSLGQVRWVRSTFATLCFTLPSETSGSSSQLYMLINWRAHKVVILKIDWVNFNVIVQYRRNFFFLHVSFWSASKEINDARSFNIHQVFATQ